MLKISRFCQPSTSHHPTSSTLLSKWPDPSWIHSHLIIKHNFSMFCTSFRMSISFLKLFQNISWKNWCFFGNSNKKHTITSKLWTFCQGSRLTPMYTFKFKQLTCDIFHKTRLHSWANFSLDFVETRKTFYWPCLISQPRVKQLRKLWVVIIDFLNIDKINVGNHHQYWGNSHHPCCHNPKLGLTTKARVCKVANQKGSSGVMPHAPGSVKECEGIGLHTPKGTPTLGSWSPGGLLNVQKTILRIKTQWIEKFFISLEIY